MLPNFKSKILTWLLDTQMDDVPLLFSLMGQCIQNVGLTKWTRVIVKRCPNDADCTKANFDKYIRDNLKTVDGFPNIGNQLFCWLCTSKKLALMPIQISCGIKYSLLAALRVATSVKWWKYPWRKRRVSKSSLCSLRQTKQVCWLEQDSAYWPAQDDCFLWAVSSDW